MAYPVLAVNGTWFSPNVSTVTLASITEIEIMDSYTPDATVTVVDFWDASAAKDGSVMCYVIGTKLIMAGNASGMIAFNETAFFMFSGANNLTVIRNANLFDTSACTKMAYMFEGCNKLLSVDVSDWDMSNVTMLNGMFKKCGVIEALNLSKWVITNKLTTIAQMFCDCIALKDVGNIANWDTSGLKYLTEAFWNCQKLQMLNIADWDLSNAVDLKNAFGSCTSLVSVVLHNPRFAEGATLQGMFTGSQIKELDVSSWDMSRVADISFMFYECSSLDEIDVSNWDVSNVTNFDHFAAHANLRRKGIGNWKTTSATNMNGLFHNCAEEELDLSGWDVSKNQFFCQMFENSTNLKRIKGLDKWNTSAGLGFDGMFERCSALEEVDLSSFNTTKAKNGTSASTNGHKTATMKNMFLSCNNLKKVIVGPNFSINGNGSNTTAANKAILPTPSTDYIEGADGNWYTFNGEAYAPNAIKDKTAETYYASPVMVYDADVIVKNSSLIDTAKAIREKNGATTHYTPAQFGAAIRAM